MDRDAVAELRLFRDWTNHGHAAPTTGTQDEPLLFQKTYDFALTCTGDGASTTVSPTVIVKSSSTVGDGDDGDSGGGGGAFAPSTLLLMLAAIGFNRRRRA